MDNAIYSDVAQPNIRNKPPKSRTHEKKLTDLMDKLERGKSNLMTYLKAVGALSMKDRDFEVEEGNDDMDEAPTEEISEEPNTMRTNVETISEVPSVMNSEVVEHSQEASKTNSAKQKSNATKSIPVANLPLCQIADTPYI